MLTYGHLTAGTVPRMVVDFLEYEKQHEAHKRGVEEVADGVTEIRICLDSCCIARGTGNVWEAMEDALAETGVHVVLKRVGCVGMCYQTPMVEIVPPDGESAVYARVRPDDAKTILLRHLKPRRISRRITTTVGAAVDRIFAERQPPAPTPYLITPRETWVRVFLDNQKHLSTEHWGHLDPTNFDEYVSLGGFNALRRVVSELSPQQVIDEVRRSGLRGRGGAGFVTGDKWARVRKATSEKKYVVMNGDEGDPGAFMDRMLLESYPYRIIEGIAIAAYAVGAHEGILYIRAEYPVAVELVSEALRQCESRGMLGERIFGSDFSLRLRIMEGAGAFVCGEETALMASSRGL